MGEASQRYLIALGSNVRHPQFGPPRSVLGAAMMALESLGEIRASSPIIDSSPVGPSLRQYANAVLLLEAQIAPDRLLQSLKAVERGFGTRRGQRWSSRVLDLDIVLWNGGVWANSELMIPHPQFRKRDFVLGPAAIIAPAWRDPITSLSIKHLNARLTKPRPIPSGRLR
jgi:2-amino-4-hydroxy-6-hydroxymethyldihydropteridine diphosphokinase